MANTMQIIKVQAVKAKVRYEMFEGKEHLVAPVIPIVEGVLNGAFVSATEIAKFVYSWAGIPIPINHPMKQGEYVSANQKDILETNVVGRFLNPKMDGPKLKGELWIDVAKATELGGEALQAMQMLQNGEQLEVSTAYFSDDVKKAGTFKGKKYSVAHTNLRPDHLALLPNAEGACNWEDGAGAPRVACKQEGGEDVPETEERNLGLLERIRAFVAPLFSINEASHEQTRDALYSVLKEEAPKNYFYIRQVWDNEFIYEDESSSGSFPKDFSTKLYKRAYVSDDAGNVTLAKDKTEVKEVRKYEPVIQANENEKEEAEELDKKTIIDGLISNGKRFTEEDRAWLDKLEVNQLSKMVPQDTTPAAPAANSQTTVVETVAPVAPVTTVAPAVNAKPITTEEYIAGIPDGDAKDFIVNNLKKQAEHRVNLLARLAANSRCAFSKEELAEFKTDKLEKLESSLAVNNYSGRSLPKGNNCQEDDDDEIPAPPPVVMAKNEDKGGK